MSKRAIIPNFINQHESNSDQDDAPILISAIISTLIATKYGAAYGIASGILTLMVLKNIPHFAASACPIDYHTEIDSFAEYNLDISVSSHNFHELQIGEICWVNEY